MIMIMSSKAEMPRKDEFSFTSATLLLLLCDMRDRWEQLWHTSTAAAAGDTRNDEQTYVHAALIKQIIASRSALSRFSRTWYDRWMLSALCHSVFRCLLMTFISSKFYLKCSIPCELQQRHINYTNTWPAWSIQMQSSAFSVSLQKCLKYFFFPFSVGNWIASTQNFEMHCYQKIFNENFPFFSRSQIHSFCSANRTILLCPIEKQCRT